MPGKNHDVSTQLLHMSKNTTFFIIQTLFTTLSKLSKKIVESGIHHPYLTMTHVEDNIQNSIVIQRGKIVTSSHTKEHNSRFMWIIWVCQLLCPPKHDSI